MDKLAAMAAFVQIVDRGSLTAAARARAVSLPTMVRTLAALESALGVRLLQRTTRRLALTDEGREYVERCRRVLAEIDEAEQALSRRRAEPRGRLVITASLPFGRWHVAPLVAQFVAEHPAVRAELLLLDRIVNLVEENVDVAVRLGHLPDSSLVATHVGETRWVIVASPAYLAAHGTPRHPTDLAAHDCVQLLGQSADWDFVIDGKPRRVATRGPFATNQVEAVIDGCLRGLGCARLFDYQVRVALGRGQLRVLLPRFAPPPVPIHVVFPHARLLSPRVRAFVDWAAPRLRKAVRARERTATPRSTS